MIPSSIKTGISPTSHITEIAELALCPVQNSLCLSGWQMATCRSRDIMARLYGVTRNEAVQKLPMAQHIGTGMQRLLLVAIKRTHEMERNNVSLISMWAKRT
ncbi:hypothetical protein XELAEV_18016436mg [Xenopus laevis]|uniref:Uncharacterized protein n=1 Tax=Xenopus laevis TaxID=8355 RepID=A0A974DKH8_XENLA|nr:hypothetical protein XELAEV_18016436mg [Xenopus laevis]